MIREKHALGQKRVFPPDNPRVELVFPIIMLKRKKRCQR
jgi:hypothetical protein